MPLPEIIDCFILDDISHLIQGSWCQVYMYKGRLYTYKGVYYNLFKDQLNVRELMSQFDDTTHTSIYIENMNKFMQSAECAF